MTRCPITYQQALEIADRIWRMAEEGRAAAADREVGNVCGIEEMARRLAILLWQYESDEPYAADEPPREFSTTWEEIETALADEHCGDCTKQPAPCITCYAEMIWRKAQWLAARLQ